MAHDAPTPNSTDRLQVAARRLIVAVLLVLGATLLWHTTGDLDLPLHDRVGRDLLNGEAFPRLNTFSFTAADHPWTDHEWAFQVFVAVAGNLTGGDTLAAREAGWHWLRLVLGMLLLLALLIDQHRSGPHNRWLVGPIALLVLSLLWTRLILRPELVSFLMFALVLPRIELAQRIEPIRPWWRDLCDPRRPGGQAFWLTMLWYQFHAFAALSVPLWLLAGLFTRSERVPAARWRLAVAGALLALVVGAITPNGLRGLLYPMQALGQLGGGGPNLRTTISEMVPLLETRGSLALTVPLFKVSLVWGLIWVVATWRRVSWLRVAVWATAAYAAWYSQRNLGFYAVALAMLHGGVFDTAAATPWSRLADRFRGTRVAAVAVFPALAALVTAGLWLAGLATDSFYLQEGVSRRFGTGLTPANYPTAIAARAATLGIARLANNVDAASTLVAARTTRVSIDGRTEAYPANAWRNYESFKAGGTATIRQVDRWSVDAVCLAHRSQAGHAALRALVADDGWVPVDGDEAGILMMRRRNAPQGAGPGVVLSRAHHFADRLDAAPRGRDVRLVDEAAAWASLLNLLGEDVLATRILTAAEVRGPDHPPILHNLGNRLLASGDLEGALRRFEAAAARNRSASPPQVNAGNCLFRLGRVEEAEAAFARAVRRNPESFEGWANLAEVRRQLGDRKGAGAAYRRALALRPGEQRLRERARGF